MLEPKKKGCKERGCLIGSQYDVVQEVGYLQAQDASSGGGLVVTSGDVQVWFTLQCGQASVFG